MEFPYNKDIRYLAAYVEHNLFRIKKRKLLTYYIIVLFYSYVVLPIVQDVNAIASALDGSPSLTVSWTAVSDESEINYTVRYSTSSGTITEPPSGASTVEGITGISTTLSGLEQGTKYYIWVAAFSTDGQGPYSERTLQTTHAGIICTLYKCIYMKTFFCIQYTLENQQHIGTNITDLDISTRKSSSAINELC